MKINTDRIEKMRRQKQMIALEQLLEEVKFYQRDKEDKGYSYYYAFSKRWGIR